MATTKLNNGTRKNSVIGQLVRVDPDNPNNYIAVDLNILDVIGTVAEVRQPGNPVTINLINDFSQMEDLINELAALLALVKAETDKIDNLATDGLSGVNGSLAHGVSEIEHHLHSAGSWFGAKAIPTATVKAVRIGDADCTHFEIDGGDSSVTPTWGDWVQIFGSDDTPARGVTMTYFDPHLLLISQAEEEVPYMIQFGRGASGAAALLAGTYTELMVGVDTEKKFKTQTPIQTDWAPAGSLIWARCIAIGKNTGWLRFYMGIHEYPGL